MDMKDPIFSQQFDLTELTDVAKFKKNMEMASQPIPQSDGGGGLVQPPSSSSSTAQQVTAGGDESAEALHQILTVVTEIRNTLDKLLQ